MRKEIDNFTRYNFSNISWDGDLKIPKKGYYEKEVGDFLVEKKFLSPIENKELAKKLATIQANIVVKGGLLHYSNMGDRNT